MLMMGAPEAEKSGNGSERTLDKIMAENFSS